jgi:hypothetical protein
MAGGVMIGRTAAAALAGLVMVAAGCAGTDATTDADSSDTRTSVPTTSGSAGPPHLVEGPATPLEPGTYQFSVFANPPGVETPDALVEVPSGFDDEAAWYVVSSDQQEFLGLWTVGLVNRDACSSDNSQLFDPGPSVEDLADALVAQKSTRASTPKPVTLAGHQGLYVELVSPHDISTCATGEIWDDRGIYNDGQVDRVWILDIGGQRLVVNAAYTPKSSAADIARLTSMVKSIEFVEAAQD